MLMQYPSQVLDACLYMLWVDTEWCVLLMELWYPKDLWLLLFDMFFSPKTII